MLPMSLEVTPARRVYQLALLHKSTLKVSGLTHNQIFSPQSGQHAIPARLSWSGSREFTSARTYGVSCHMSNGVCSFSLTRSINAQLIHSRLASLCTEWQYGSRGGRKQDSLCKCFSSSYLYHILKCLLAKPSHIVNPRVSVKSSTEKCVKRNTWTHQGYSHNQSCRDHQFHPKY